jgi:hypothetical protein
MDKKMIRFIDSNYKDLFSIPDGGNVALTLFDGETIIRPCQYMDECHAKIGHRVFHICEFAEIMERNGTIYAPEVMQNGDIFGTYEIYQIKDVRSTDYCFRSYAEAFSKISRNDYTRMYAGMLAPNMSLDHLYAKHNMDNRPFGDRMRSLSMSDVIVINRDGKATAYYVDTVGFKEVPQFLNIDRRKLQQEKDEDAPPPTIPKKRHEPER